MSFSLKFMASCLIKGYCRENGNVTHAYTLVYQLLKANSRLIYSAAAVEADSVACGVSGCSGMVI